MGSFRLQQAACWNHRKKINVAIAAKYISHFSIGSAASPRFQSPSRQILEKMYTKYFRLFYTTQIASSGLQEKLEMWQNLYYISSGRFYGLHTFEHFQAFWIHFCFTNVLPNVQLCSIFFDFVPKLLYI